MNWPDLTRNWSDQTRNDDSVCYSVTKWGPRAGVGTHSMVCHIMSIFLLQFSTWKAHPLSLLAGWWLVWISEDGPVAQKQNEATCLRMHCSTMMPNGDQQRSKTPQTLQMPFSVLLNLWFGMLFLRFWTFVCAFEGFCRFNPFFLVLIFLVSVWVSV